MSVFTSTRVHGNIRPSLLFQEKGNATDVACKLSELDIQHSGRPTNTLVDLYYANFEYAVASTVLAQTIIRAGLPNSGYVRATSFTYPTDFFTFPPIGVNYPASAMSPSVEERLVTAGFTKISVGQLRYYKGSIAPRLMYRI